MDLPGQGAPKRLMNLHMPPDTERLVSPIVDYLQSRPDVDPERIGLRGQSMGGYSAPRAASGESRIKAVWMGAGSHDVLRDLFEFYPPIPRPRPLDHRRGRPCRCAAQARRLHGGTRGSPDRMPDADRLRADGPDHGSAGRVQAVPGRSQLRSPDVVGGRAPASRREVGRAAGSAPADWRGLGREATGRAGLRTKP